MYLKSLVVSLVLSAFAVIDSAAADHDGAVARVCPKLCTCDIVEGLKRADCSHENLINPYTDVPTGVEILDLSINKISAIEDDDFKDYTNLVKLFLSENSIQSISLNAFSTMRNLEILDLSHNRLQRLHENMFEYNEKLVDLNLSNNNFMTLYNQPLLISSSIMHLDLSDCKIPQLYERTFTGMPALRTLELTNNVMITLAKDPLSQLKNLRVLNLHDNQWKCDSESVRATVNWLRRRVSSLQIEQCFLTPFKSKAMFEKMELDPRQQVPRQEVSIDQVWGGSSTTEKYWNSLQDKTCSYNDAQRDPERKQTCEDFIECQKRFSELYHAFLAKVDQQGQAKKFNHQLAVILLTCGVFIGVLFGSFFTYSLLYLAKKCRKSDDVRPPSATMRQMRREFRERNNFEHSRLNESPPPDQLSRRTTTNLTPQELSQIYRNHEHTRQFLVDLFSKRQPRYVRNNSQLANLQNRYLPPTPTRNEPGSPVARTSSSFIWQSAPNNRSNEELERMLTAAAGSHQSSNLSVWNNYYGIDEPQAPRSASEPAALYEVVPIGTSTTPPPVLQRSISMRRETPPPPYVDCARAIGAGSATVETVDGVAAPRSES
uniref:Protein slit n=1 Tax=Culex pipiens TaxID=7175 RepID=A0A8D8BEJ1_CULPI